MPNLQIISANVCPYAQRTRMVLHEKGLKFDLVEIDLKDKPDWFLEVSPYGKVPVLRHNERTIYESAVINEYLDEAFPDHLLMPVDPAARAMARIWIDYINNQFCPFFYKVLLAQDGETQKEVAEKLTAVMKFMENEGLKKLQGKGPYWMGENPNLVDLTLYPFFERFVVLEHYRGVVIPKDCQRLSRWLDVMLKHPASVATANTKEFHINNYQKYADGSANGVTAREMRK
ncbi:MAG: glutathione S-transferase family protein [Rhodospirillales bacterium]|nr:glutathione S-transferase family protein [Rhodospirillales bacterium]